MNDPDHDRAHQADRARHDAASHTPAAASATSHATAGFTAAMSAAMERMMTSMNAAGHSGDPDVDFLAMMIPHHEGAVEMARLELVHGRDPLARRLAEEILASQSAEIDAMRRRLAILRRGAEPEPDGFPAIGGTRGSRR